jgi:hypothetical protein
MSTALPSDLVSLITQLDDATNRASAMVANLSDTQANWQPQPPTGWSIVQCLDHMAVANRSYLFALKAAAERAHPGHVPIRPAGWLSRYFLRKTEPPVAIKIKAPKSIRPPSNLPKQDALAHFQQSNREVCQFVIKTADLDLSGIRFKNPFVPLVNFTVATGLLDHCA